MACLLFTAGLFNIVQIISPSTETEILSKVPDNIGDAVDGEKFFKNVVNGEKLKEQPEYLLFTAPFRICKGGCSNISNFNMLFPIYVGQKKSQIMYPKIYSEDHQNIHSKADRAPFRESTTRVPFPTCPTCSNDFEEGIRPPSIGPNCKVKVSQVDFGATRAFATKNLLRRKHVVLHDLHNDKLLRTDYYLSNSRQQSKEKIDGLPFRSNK